MTSPADYVAISAKWAGEPSKSKEALSRAGRMLDALTCHSHDTTDFRDRLPYVLDLLAGSPARSIPKASATGPGLWSGWGGVDRSAQQTIQEMPNAELKELVSRAAAQIEVGVNVRAADYPESRVNDGDTVVTVSWAFNGGALHGQPVLKALRDYLQQLTALLEEAERKLAS